MTAAVPLRVITQVDVRASIRRAKASLEKAAEEIIWQIEMETWRTLGYGSWDAMREAEYGDAAFMVPRRQRPELVARMRSAGLTQQQIADTAGVTHTTVQRDLNAQMCNEGDPEPPMIANSRGQQRPASYAPPHPTPNPDAHPKADAEEAPTPATTVCPTCGGTGKVYTS